MEAEYYFNSLNEESLLTSTGGSIEVFQDEGDLSYGNYFGQEDFRADKPRQTCTVCAYYL